jgi:ArsR family transcriptional regulator, arsenate/arsenite/antimonite-responsive transcriptional repressor
LILVRAARACVSAGPLVATPVVRGYSCIMVQVRKRSPMSPRQAAACCGPLDDLLDPAFFKALCDPTRARLLGCMIKCGRSCTVTEVAECCSVDLSVVSRHLRVLEKAGVLESSKAGRTVSYLVRFGPLCDSLRELAGAIEACTPCRAVKSRKGACRGEC